MTNVVSIEDRIIQAKDQTSMIELGKQLEELLKPTMFGWYRNYWRGRDVYVYPHPSEASKVITIGWPSEKTIRVPGAVPTICIESRETWKDRIDNNDWRDYF